MASSSVPPRLIINADDYGYFASVSRGILEGAAKGVVTATGIMANSPRFDEYMPWLTRESGLDLGVHLNLTHGQPLTEGMARYYEASGGSFRSKFSTALAILSGRISVVDVIAEWRAQIRRCLEAGLQLCFLNSHEHLHSLPVLFPKVRRLAEEFGIKHVRLPTPEWSGNWKAGSVIRNLIFEGLCQFNRSRAEINVPLFLGMAASGTLSLAYFQRQLPRLQHGKVYELMCHPGFYDAEEIRDPALLSYHRWEQELQVLTGDDLKLLLRHENIELVGYRDLREIVAT